MGEQLTVGSLFSGIGGLDLGLERAGMRVIWQSEIDPYASRVLKKHWPEVPNYGDIKEIQWRNVIRPDVLCGGYPCQPFSFSGTRSGTDDPRHLWPWVLNAISELRPKYAVLENVRGHLSLGGLSVIGDLAAVGYDAEWRIVSAASVGAFHRRDRLFIISYPAGEGLQRDFGAFEKIRKTNVFTGGGWWSTEPDVGRMANGVPKRVDRLKGLGNAVVPQVAEVIGRLVVEHANNG
jgi:DNA (cytosine-5)-methyltransferase 1